MIYHGILGTIGKTRVVRLFEGIAAGGDPER